MVGTMNPMDAGTPETGPGAIRRLILASRSPRRRQLLDEAGIAHTVRLAEEIDDGDLSPGSVTPENWVAALAYLKARAVAECLNDGAEDIVASVVLGADTVCVQEGEIIGKPADRDAAERTIRLFSEAEHDVLTGVALVDETQRIVDLFVDRARVRVGEITDEQIEAYLETDMWHGKAGAYNLFERIEAGWPIEFDGDGTTIVGLPMDALGKRFSSLGFIEPRSA
jgi:septum formation protein